ncbi:MAG TPA: transcriptional regulator [Steroidobacteraceae bacterium]|jgi:DNA-binding MarR family transcriptional regulator|nr:transcriptional regulator [Steroidobacteraceae bacterium]
MAKRQEAHGSASAKSSARPAPVSYGTANGGHSGFDRLIYERVRLGIMSALATNEELTFNELKSLFNASDGNLGAHARKLEEAGYVACTKSFEARRPKSIYRITAAGRKALLRYLEHIEAVIKATRRV